MTNPTTPAARTCKRPDCTSPAKSRGLCGRHYTQWYDSLDIKPTRQKSTDLVLAEMPGTYAEIAARAGVSYGKANIAINKLHAAKLIHVAEMIPPSGGGGRWIKSFAAGPGKDAKVTNAMRHAHTQHGRRIKHHAMRAVRARDPLVRALFGVPGRGANNDGGAAT